MTQIKLFNLLKTMDEDLHNKLLYIKEVTRNSLSYTAVKFPTYTPHDCSHSESVETTIDILIPDAVKENFSAYEIFFLLAATWLHDCGMISVDNEPAEDIREIHHILSEKFITTYNNELNINLHEAAIIGKIAKGHRKEDIYSKEFADTTFGLGNKIRLRLLTAILRLADECDITHTRISSLTKKIQNPIDNSAVEFMKHERIRGIHTEFEWNKIVISAISNNQAEANTLRAVQKKIQNELNNIKIILNDGDIKLETVEMDIEAIGFFDCNISFEVDKEKITELLIGEHLYQTKDVAIRELIQNSIDACSACKSERGNMKITVKKIDKKTLLIEDNGSGMSLDHARGYLAAIGKSAYTAKGNQHRDFVPISRFGIGILSAFLISNSLTIETKSKNDNAYKFIINDATGYWDCIHGTRKENGTTITLELNEYGQTLNVVDIINKYFLCPSISINYIDEYEKIIPITPKWDPLQILTNALPKETHCTTMKEILRYDSEDFDLIVCIGPVVSRNVIILNQGIYITTLRINLSNRFLSVYVNTKKDLFDIHMSRSSIVDNDKLNNFLYNIFSTIITEVSSIDDKFEAIKALYLLIEGRRPFTIKNDPKILDTPFCKAFFDHAIFILIKDKKPSFINLRNINIDKHINVYSILTNNMADELEILTTLSSENEILVNPYELARFHSDDESRKTTFETYLTSKRYHAKNIILSRLIIESSRPVTNYWPDLIPQNITLAIFPNNIKPLVMLDKKAIVNQSSRLGNAFWGNIIAFSSILDKNSYNDILSSLPSHEKKSLESVQPHEVHTVYLDINDEFISAILGKLNDKAIKDNLVDIVHRYFIYISHLPLITSNITSLIFFFEIIQFIENIISSGLGITNVKPFYRRTTPKFSFYAEYFDNFGEFYIEK